MLTAVRTKNTKITKKGELSSRRFSLRVLCVLRAKLLLAEHPNYSFLDIADMPKKYEMPKFLDEHTKPDVYQHWLHQKATAHVKRDRKRGRKCSVSIYKQLIHAAVELSGGADAYTGEPLQWELISTYTNEDSKKGKHAYKAGFALLPTVDHVSAEVTEASFKICAWRTNDSKNDLSLDAFKDLCERILTHAGYKVEKPS